MGGDAAEPFCRGLEPGEFQANYKTNYKMLVKQRKCPAYLLPSQPVLGRCIPTGSSNNPTASALVQEAKAPTAQPSTPSVEEVTQMNATDLKDGWKFLVKSLNLKDFGAKILADLALDWWVLVIALLLACIFSFLWIFLLRLAAGVIVWTTIVLCCLLLSAITGFSFYQYFITREKEVAGFDDIFLQPGFETIVNQYFDQNTWLTVGIVMGVVTLVIFLVLLFLIKRIQIAVELIEEASKAVGAAMTTLIFPIVPFLFQTLVLVWFLMVASCLATAGEKEYKVNT
jgi:choline transporter-like protein 2/4/5